MVSVPFSSSPEPHWGAPLFHLVLFDASLPSSTSFRVSVDCLPSFDVGFRADFSSCIAGTHGLQFSKLLSRTIGMGESMAAYVV